MYKEFGMECYLRLPWKSPCRCHKGQCLSMKKSINCYRVYAAGFKECKKVVAYSLEITVLNAGVAICFTLNIIQWKKKKKFINPDVLAGFLETK